ITLQTYIVFAFVSFKALTISLIIIFGNILVYKLPGDMTITSASKIASTVSGSGFTLFGVRNTRSIFLLWTVILDSPIIIIPSSINAFNTSASLTTGIIFAFTWKMFANFFTAS